MQQEIISEPVPDLIIESGAANGGSALTWAIILRELNPQGRIITVDIEDLAQKAKTTSAWIKLIEQIVGSSTDPAVFRKIQEQVKV